MDAIVDHEYHGNDNDEDDDEDDDDDGNDDDRRHAEVGTSSWQVSHPSHKSRRYTGRGLRGQAVGGREEGTWSELLREHKYRFLNLLSSKSY